MGYPHAFARSGPPSRPPFPGLTRAVVPAPWPRCFHILGANFPRVWRREGTGGHALLTVHLHVVTILW